MGKRFIRKSKSWLNGQMQEALTLIHDGKCSRKKAAVLFGTPRETLKRRYRLCVSTYDMAVACSKGLGSKNLFCGSHKQTLWNYVLKMERQMLGLTSQELKFGAYQYAEKLDIQYNFIRERGLAGKDWISGFMKRHTYLSLRKPEATSIARATGFNYTAVTQSDTLLGKVLLERNIPPERMHNVDEKVVTAVSKSYSRIIAQKGQNTFRFLPFQAASVLFY